MQQISKPYCPIAISIMDTGHDKVGGTMQCYHWLPKITSRKYPGITGQTIGIKQNQIDISDDLQMLKSVIEQKNISTHLDGTLGRQSADDAGEHRYARQSFSKQSRLVTGHFRVEQQGDTIGNHINFGVCPAAVPSADHSRMKTVFPQLAGKILHHRGLACSPHGQIAHTDHRHIEPVRLQNTPTIPSFPKTHGKAVDRGKVDGPG